MKSWCSGWQQISTSSPVQFTLFTIRQNLTKVFFFPSNTPGGAGRSCRHCRRPCAFGSSNTRLQHSIALPLSHFLPNNLWALNNLFFPFSVTFFQLPTWLLLSGERLSKFGAWFLAGDLFPCGWGGISRGRVVCMPISGELWSCQT